MSIVTLALSFALVTTLSSSQDRGRPEEASVTLTPEIMLSEVHRQLELDPEEPGALVRASELYGEVEDEDAEIAYLLLAIDAIESLEFDSEDAREDRLAPLEKRLSKLKTGLTPLPGYRKTYLKDLTKVMTLYAQNQRKPLSALEIAGQILRYRPDHYTARRTVEGLLGPDGALRDIDEYERREANSLLEIRELDRPRSYRTRWLAEHGDWDHADRLEVDEYVVRTDIGYDVLQKAARGLDQIAVFYRRFYGTDRTLQVGKTSVDLCRSRDDFEAVAQNPITENPGLLAFISTQVRTITDESGEKREISFSIYGFDPRDRGMPLERLWSTLWHEASHQYMKLALAGEGAPPWLDEGMAAYFEGARVSGGGRVEIGLPARERLDRLQGMLAAGARPLAELLSHEAGLPGDLYPVAWGLVYHLQHARDETGELTLRPLLTGAMERLAANGRVGAAALFESAVLEPLGVELKEFEDEWIEGILALHRRESDPAAFARELVAEGQEHLAAGRLDLAQEFFHDARLRAPRRPEPMLGLAQVLVERWKQTKKRDDDLADQALRWAGRAHHAATVLGEEAQLELAAESARLVDIAGFDKVARAEKRYRDKVSNLVQRQVESGHPRTAIVVARIYLDDALGDASSSALAVDLRQKEVLSIERRRRMFDGETLVGLSAASSFGVSPEGEIVCRVARPDRAALFLDEPLAPTFRVEAEVLLEDSNSILGVSYTTEGSHISHGFALRPRASDGEKQDRSRYLPFELLPPGRIAEMHETFVEELRTQDFVLTLPGRELEIEPGRWMQVEVSNPEPGILAIRLDGKEVHRCAIPVEPALTEDGGLGLLLCSGSLRVRNVVVIEPDRL